jgi:hypothetical protein
MPTETATFPRLDRSKLIQHIAVLANAERALHKAFSLDHRSQEFADALKTLGLSSYHGRNHYAQELTACYIALAASRGKTHCDVKAWAEAPENRWRAVKLLQEAEARITPKAPVPENPGP